MRVIFEFLPDERSTMPYIKYRTFRFRQPTLDVIEQAETILAEYRAQGYELTLRQLYYQFVARALIPNTDREYSKLGDIVSNARLAGLIDWNSIMDRTRRTQDYAAWEDPADRIAKAANGYQINLWEGQPNHVEVWVEKDALIGVVSQAADEWRIPYVSCRGYVSQSQMWRSAMRFRQRLDTGRDVHILHLGDHDPSGIDMTRDIEERLGDFIWGHRGTIAGFHVHRIALNMDQVTLYNPPPNPAKVTDSRFEGYRADHGDESWELDALEPRIIEELIRDAADPLIDHDLMQERLDLEAEGREFLQLASERWAEIEELLRS